MQAMRAFTMQPSVPHHEELGTHFRYNRFLDHGEADAYGAKPEEFRVAPGKVK